MKMMVVVSMHHSFYHFTLPQYPLLYPSPFTHYDTTIPILLYTDTTIHGLALFCKGVAMINPIPDYARLTTIALGQMVNQSTRLEHNQSSM